MILLVDYDQKVIIKHKFNTKFDLNLNFLSAQNFTLGRVIDDPLNEKSFSPEEYLCLNDIKVELIEPSITIKEEENIGLLNFISI